VPPFSAHLKLLQREVAVQLGVTETCLFNWEANISVPEIRYMPAIISFLGYNPLPRIEDAAGKCSRRLETWPVHPYGLFTIINPQCVLHFPPIPINQIVKDRGRLCWHHSHKT
jgi:DNA-binding XRE family transcriptional regulator